MDITFDPAKDLANQEKHGCSLALAEAFEWDDALEIQDNRRNYGEARYSATGYIGERLYVVVYTDRTPIRRIISLRKANAREVRKYAKA